MNCPRCGAVLPDNSAFCGNCGLSFQGGAQQAQPMNPGVPPMNAGTPPMSGVTNKDDWSTFSTASGIEGLKYVVLQVTLKEKFLGTGSGNLTALEQVINEQANKGYRLHTITTASATSGGFLGGDRIQATMVFERLY